MSRKYKSTGKIGLFDKLFSTEQLTEMGNPLEAINKVIDFEYFRSIRCLRSRFKGSGYATYGRR